MYHTFSILILFILAKNTTTRYRIRPERSSEPKISSTCYDHLGCVDINEKWYDSYYRPVNLEPLDRHTIRTEFLYMKPAKNNSKDVLYDILTLKHQTLNLAGYKHGVYTFFLIHDFTSNGYTGWIKHMALGIAGEMEANVISVDWEPGAEPPFDQAISNARVVALEIQLFIKMLKEHFDIVPDKIHLVGHGVGAHIAGYVGKNVKGINRITALDPTGPRFENMPCIVRLDPDDAKYVEVLHTEAFNSRSQGTLQPMGHSDFYLNNAGYQPGCNETGATTKLADVTRSQLREGKILPACSHKRAFKYYISAITTRECKFVGIACSSYETFMNGSCSDCDNNLCASFDFCPPPDNVYKTKFFVNTHSDPPFCMYAYQVNISIESNEHSRKLDGHFEFILTDINNKLAFAVGSGLGSTARSFVPGVTYTLIVYAPPPAVTMIKEAKVRWRCKPTFPFMTKAIYVKYIAVRRVPMMGESAPIIGMCPETGPEIKDSSYIQFVCCDVARIQEEQRIATLTTTTTPKTTTVLTTTTTTPAPINVTWPLPNATTTTVKPPTQCLVKETGQAATMTPSNLGAALGAQAGLATPASVGGGNGSAVGNMTQTHATSPPEDLTNKIIFDEIPNATTTTTLSSEIASMASTKKKIEEEEEEEIGKGKEEHTTSEMEEEIRTGITTVSAVAEKITGEEEKGTEGTTIKAEVEQEEILSTKEHSVAENEETTAVGGHSTSEIFLTPKEELLSTMNEETVSGISAHEATTTISSSPRSEAATLGQASSSSMAMTIESQPHTEQQIETTISSIEINATTFLQEQSTTQEESVAVLHTTESVSAASIAKQTASNAVEGTLESQTEIQKGMENVSHHTLHLSTLSEEHTTFAISPKSTEIPEFITPKTEESMPHPVHNETEIASTEAGEVKLESTIKASTMLETEASPAAPSEGSTAAGVTEIVKISEAESETCTEWNSTEPDEFLEGGITSHSEMGVSGTTEGYVTMVVEAQVVTELITEAAGPTENIIELSTHTSEVAAELTALTGQEGQAMSTTQTAFESLSKHTAAVQGVGITGEGAAHQAGKGVSSIVGEMTESSTGGIGTERSHTEVGEETGSTSGKPSTGGIGTQESHTEVGEETGSTSGKPSTGGIGTEESHTEVGEETGSISGKPSGAEVEYSSATFEPISKQTGEAQASELTENAETYQASKGVSSTLEGEIAESPREGTEHFSTPFEAISKQTGALQESELTENAETYQASMGASTLGEQKAGTSMEGTEYPSTSSESISKQTGEVQESELTGSAEVYQTGKSASSTLEGQKTESPEEKMEQSSTLFESVSKQTAIVQGSELTENAEIYQTSKGVSSTLAESSKQETEHSSTPLESISRQTGVVAGSELTENTGSYQTSIGASSTLGEQKTETSKEQTEHVSTTFETISKQTGAVQEIELTENAEAYQGGKGVSSMLTEQATELSTGKVEQTEAAQTEAAEETRKTSETGLEHLTTPPEMISKQTAIVHGAGVSEKGEAYQMGKNISSELEHSTEISETGASGHTEIGEVTPMETEMTAKTPMQHLPTPAEIVSEEVVTVHSTEGHTIGTSAKAEETEMEHTHTEVAGGTPEKTERTHETQTTHLASEATSKQAETEESTKEIVKTSATQTERTTTTHEATAAKPSTEEFRETEKERPHTEVAEEVAKETEEPTQTQTKHSTAHRKETTATKGHLETTTKQHTTEKVKEHAKTTPARKEPTTECNTEDLPECEEVEDSADFGDDETSSSNVLSPQKTTQAGSKETEKESKTESKTEHHDKSTELLTSTSSKSHHTVKETNHVTHPEHTTGKSKDTKEHKNKTATTRKDYKRTDSTSELPECDDLEL